MSYYYNYYIGYKKNNKFYPLGPYTDKGKIQPVISKSRSFASNLYQDFYKIKEENVSEPLIKEFGYKSFEGKTALDVKYLKVKDLPQDSFVKKGYFLIKDVKEYEEHPDCWFDGFYDYLSPTIYSTMLTTELLKSNNQNNSNSSNVNCYKDESESPKKASEYMWYAYPDYYCKEYEVEILRTVAYSLWSWGDDEELVILETEG